jgi:hypothetical protein
MAAGFAAPPPLSPHPVDPRAHPGLEQRPDGDLRYREETDPSEDMHPSRIILPVSLTRRHEEASINIVARTSRKRKDPVPPDDDCPPETRILSTCTPVPSGGQACRVSAAARASAHPRLPPPPCHGPARRLALRERPVPRRPPPLRLRARPHRQQHLLLCHGGYPFLLRHCRAGAQRRPSGFRRRSPDPHDQLPSLRRWRTGHSRCRRPLAAGARRP